MVIFLQNKGCFKDCYVTKVKARPKIPWGRGKGFYYDSA